MGQTPNWDDITALANRFDCLALAGGMQRAATLADRLRAAHLQSGAWPGTAAELEACLSFECRTWQHCGMVPDGDDLQYIAALYASLQGLPDV